VEDLTQDVQTAIEQRRIAVSDNARLATQDADHYLRAENKTLKDEVNRLKLENKVLKDRVFPRTEDGQAASQGTTEATTPPQLAELQRKNDKLSVENRYLKRRIALLTQGTTAGFTPGQNRQGTTDNKSGGKINPLIAEINLQDQERQAAAGNRPAEINFNQSL
jgi:cell division protein FtsB